jgi:hypothetical protein
MAVIIFKWKSKKGMLMPGQFLKVGIQKAHRGISNLALFVIARFLSNTFPELSVENPYQSLQAALSLIPRFSM